ncbi:hypothetical protein SEA_NIEBRUSAYLOR_19 [Mycobacterium phage NiebruSaylor]|uniref:Uncharacterized protein n=6 Tax=Viruses TaxID=10239 RepID=Q856S3_BPMCO|nr:gp21 [Mycobacterium phage Corndog]YP_008409187.1 hypothetical protein PBI_CATDAWG_18 [Mycobacterium phage Catdawg]YP_008530583.1 hypothetical protein PBI_DYLAN_19 [Mycobacterium phage Dylan]YP_010097511.1 hypothetical protein KNU03_gp021 [Mycobacterium phage Ryadel]ALA48863.1 hypothetical protein ZAKHE101_20 [Mycobacterium phage Zakhe101]ATW60501.1 hypothetical protein SEA_FAMILTON_19 [Mycobacterium phage Familton]AVI04049.1 hypothetical protein SEA_JANGDYNASTY_18 [Mycobacterium phage Jang
MKIIKGFKVGRRKTVEPKDVIQSELDKAYALHPAHLMAGSVVNALAEAGFRIISEDELSAEIAAAHEAGFEEGSIL